MFLVGLLLKVLEPDHETCKLEYILQAGSISRQAHMESHHKINSLFGLASFRDKVEVRKTNCFGKKNVIFSLVFKIISTKQTNSRNFQFKIRKKQEPASPTDVWLKPCCLVGSL